MAIKQSRTKQKLIKAFLILLIPIVIFIIGQTYSLPYVTSIGIIFFLSLAGLIAPASKDGESADEGGDYN